MCNKIVFLNLQVLANFIRNHTGFVRECLEDVRGTWEGKTVFVPLELEAGLHPNMHVQCRVVTRKDAPPRFCFHLETQNQMVLDAYVAGGFILDEVAPSVIVGSRKYALT